MKFIRSKAVYIIVGLLLLFVGSFVVSDLLTPNSNTEEPVNNAVESVGNTEPQFIKEGELWFLTDKGDTITQIDIELADNESETTQGLMFRKKMNKQQGMVFVFPDEDMRSFWMKNTYLPLDIIYVDANGVIGSSQNYTTPYSEESLPSELAAKYVVEVNAGFWDTYKLKKGYKMAYKRND